MLLQTETTAYKNGESKYIDSKYRYTIRVVCRQRYVSRNTV